VPVHGEIADAGDAAGVPAGQPVDDVDVVRTLLQQQAHRLRALGVPVLEVEVTAGPDEVPAPDRPHPADAAGVDDLLHLPHPRHTPHTVAYAPARPPPLRAP